MKIWIINIGENLPIDGENPRIFRCGILANFLHSRGHEVLWWTSTFNHTLKKHRFDKNKSIEIKENYYMRLLYGAGYKRNVSFRRIIDHYILGKKFYKEANQSAKPDVILTSLPIISMSYYAAKYGKENNIPVVVDARDMWPDIFEEEIPNALKLISNVLLIPIKKRATFALKNSTAVTGMTLPFVEWGVSKAERSMSSWDIPFPFGYEKKTFSEQQNEVDNYWRGLKIDPKSYNISIVSSIMPILDIDFIISCAQSLHEKKINVNILVAGYGILFDSFQEKIKGLDNIRLLGWLDGKQISEVLEKSIAGFIPYINRKDFLSSIPNKVPEYMSKGLPVISSLGGLVGKLVEENKCGVFVKTSDEFVLEVEQMINNPEHLKHLSENSMKYFNNNFDAQIVYNNMCDFLENITQLKS